MAGVRGTPRPAESGVILSPEEEENDLDQEEWSSDEEEDEEEPPSKARRGEGEETAGSVPTPGPASSLPTHPSPQRGGTSEKGDHHHHHHHRTSRSEGVKAGYRGVRGHKEKHAVPYDSGDWDDRELRRYVYRRGDYISDPRDVAGELTMDDITGPEQGLVVSPENEQPPTDHSGPTDQTEVLGFFDTALKNLDGPRILGLSGTMAEDHCILSHLVGPDQHRHREKVKEIVSFSPRFKSQGQPEEGATSTQSKSTEEKYLHKVAEEILHMNTFSLQQRLLLACREPTFGENLTAYLADKFLNGVLGALVVHARARTGRNFILDNNPSKMMLSADDCPDRIIYTGKPDFMIYVRSEGVPEPELFCVVEVKKKCPPIEMSASRAEGKRGGKVKHGQQDDKQRQRLSKVRWHEVNDNSGKKRLASTTFTKHGGELLAYLLLAYANNKRTCFQKSKYLGMLIHGTKIQLVVAKMKNAPSVVDSVQEGAVKPSKKLCCQYAPNLDYFIPEERQKLLEILVNLVL